MNYCSSCGQRAELTMQYCPSCGQKLGSNVFCLDDLSVPPDDTGPRAGIIAVQIRDNAAPLQHDKEADAASKAVYYSDEKGVCLTPNMLVIPGKTPDASPSTYALDNITSIKSEKDISARIIGITGVVFGIALIIARDTIDLSIAVGIGVALMVLGLMIAVFVRPVYHLKIAGSHGEADVFKTSRKQEFDRIFVAINEVLLKRGLSHLSPQP